MPEIVELDQQDYTDDQKRYGKCEQQKQSRFVLLFVGATKLDAHLFVQSLRRDPFSNCANALGYVESGLDVHAGPNGPYAQAVDALKAADLLLTLAGYKISDRDTATARVDAKVVQGADATVFCGVAYADVNFVL